MLGALLRREDRSTPSLSWPDYLRLWETFGFAGTQYMVPNGALGSLTAMQGMRNPIVQAAIAFRVMTISEAPIVFRKKGTIREFKSGPALDIIRRPFVGAQPGELLAQMELDACLYGNSYWARTQPNEVTWIDPTKMKILTGDRTGPSGRFVGNHLLAYQVQDEKGQPEETYLPGEIMHFRSPLIDPKHRFRGLSWLSSLLEDIVADNDMTTYKHSFLTNAATPNLVVKFTNNIGQDAFKAFRERFEASHTGPAQGFKTMYLGAGADVQVVGSNFADLNLNENQGYGETRIAVASQVPASLLGVAEGLKGSALNAGNYAATRRKYADTFARPEWRNICGALEMLVPPPAGYEVWYDERQISFLLADMQDLSKVRQADAASIVQLSNAGFDPQSVVDAIANNDLSGLKHSGLLSVQLQDPTAGSIPPADDPADGGDNGTDGNTEGDGNAAGQ